MKKRRVSVTLNANAVKHARAMGLNLSYELNECLARLVRGTETPAMVRIYFLAREVHGLKQRLREMIEKRYGQVGDSRERNPLQPPRSPARPRQSRKIGGKF